ncbi:MAG: MarR family transcriptional regulator [Dehalococcoidales bacterium]|nr:MarR family transcriptional regulator [Dehalococcoidales bacterium]
MNKNSEIGNNLGDADFKLWRPLDHTWFMVGRSRGKELARFGLTPEQSHVLDILAMNGGSITINEIVNITQRQHHSISTLITRMTRQGLVLKTKNARDFRKWDVTVTEKGQKLFERLTRDSIKEICSCLSTEDKAELNASLRQLLVKAYEVLGQPHETNIYRADDGYTNPSE